MFEKAVQILRAAGLVAFATETVYGLGADATNSIAVRKIFAAKGRPATNPLIVHVADVNSAKRYAAIWPSAADQLVAAFWPGPLTMVVRKSPVIVPEVTAGGETVGLRVPNHPLALQLLKEFDGPIAAPSANRANRISPTCAADVRAELGDTVDLILDGGLCKVGIESTVIDLSGHLPTILRPGSITREQIQQVIGPVELFTGSVDESVRANSPGQQVRHYAPVTPTFWFERDRQFDIQQNTTVLSIGRDSSHAPDTVAMADKPTAYAQQLYAALRAADKRNLAAIYIEMPPDEPRWAAVRDRISRAATRLPVTRASGL